jgi:hypothetical protein
MKRLTVLTAAALAAAVALLAGCTSSTTTPQRSRDERVAEYFHNTVKDIATKEQVSAAPTAYLSAGADTAPDGTEISLWVSDPADPVKVRSRCFYLDMQQRDGGAGGFGGCGAVDGRDVSLSGDDTHAIGSVSGWDAASVRIAGSGATQTVSVVGGYFLVPVKFTAGVDEPLSLTLLDKSGAEMGTVTGLTPPGSAVPVAPTRSPTR